MRYKTYCCCVRTLNLYFSLLRATSTSLQEEEAEEAERIRAKAEAEERARAEEAEQQRLKGKTPEELFNEVDTDGSV